MKDEILIYLEMCRRQGMSLQQGMNFRSPPAHGVILMSRRPNAPYADEMSPDEAVLIYEGHDAPRSGGTTNPKVVDQPRVSASGKLTQNGQFAAWVEASKEGRVPSAIFRVYEKLRTGIWADRGLYLLSDYKYPLENGRRVFKFRMDQAGFDSDSEEIAQTELKISRQIPSHVKQEVYKRDRGQCVICKATDQLHFDHDFPVSKGGTSILAENVRILCARHNLAKSANIE